MIRIPVLPITKNANLSAGAISHRLLSVSETPITFLEWRACVNGGGCAGYMPDMQGWTDDTPAVNISYIDAKNYIVWLTQITGRLYRLIREGEWAFVALGDTDQAYPWGDEFGDGQTNCLDCGSVWDGKRASPVKSFAPNKFGLFDMVGNVAHWTDETSSAVTLAGKKCAAKNGYAAIFGASWANPSKYLSTEEWACFRHIMRDDTIGFRVVSEHHIAENTH